MDKVVPSPMTVNKELYPNQQIYERDNFKCRYCGWDGLKDFESWFIANFNVDHIKPASLGGNNNAENLVLACRACNLYKGKVDCNSFEEARDLVNRKRAEAENWYRKNVLKIDS
jgi:5-methylcytosine-specific restriction endonuclease McrA